MHRSIAVFIAALAASSLASNATAATMHRCTQTSISVNESQRFINIELVRSGNIIKPSVGMIQVFNTRNWFLPSGLFRLEFAKGEIRKSIRLAIDDMVYTGTQTTNAVCGGTVDGVTLPAQSELTITVTDNELPPVLVAPAVFDVTETDATQEIEIPISVTTPFGRGGVVRVQATSTSAELHHDYELGRSALFDPDETTDVIRLTIFGDDIPEIDKEILLTLSGDVPTRQLLVRIHDDEQAPFALAFDKPSYDLTEGTLTVTLTRSGDVTIPFTAFVRLRSVQPYLWPEPISVSFAAGETTKTVSIPFNNEFYSGDRAGFLDAVVNLTIRARSALLVREDDSIPVLSLIAISDREPDPPALKFFPFMLRLSRPLELPLPVRVKTFDGTAGEADYVPLDTTFTIPPASPGMSFEVTVYGDDLLEPDETFGVKISECCGGLAVIGNDTATTTIINDDDGRARTIYQFENLPANWNESQKWVTATIVKGNNLDLATTATVSLTRSKGLTIEPIPVRFEPGESRKTVQFYIDDPYYTPEVSAALVIHSGSVFTDDRRTLTIVDDEPRSVVSIEGFDLLESQVIRLARISIDPPSTAPITLRMTLKDASADVIFAPELVHLQEYRSTVTVPITVLEDSEPEPDVTFKLAIEVHPSTPYATIGQGEAMFRVRDDDAAGARLKFPTLLRRGEKVSVILELDSPAPIADVIQLSTSTPGILGIPATFPIAAGSNTATFEVEGLHAGIGLLKVNLPASLGSGKIETQLDVYGLAIAVAPELTQTVAVGETVEIEVSMSPPLDHEVRLEVASLDNRLLLDDYELIVPAGGTAKLRVRGVKSGRGTVVITVPRVLGGSVVHVPFDITLPPAP